MRKSITYISVGIFSLFLTKELKAQDPQFTQYYSSALNLNPAATGVFNGQFRASTNYRQQWSGIFSDLPLRTVHASFDYRFETFNEDVVAVGTNILHDESGASSRMQSTRLNFSAAYQKQLGGNRYSRESQFLIFGIQGGAAQTALGIQDLWFSRQYDSLGINVNTNLPSGEATPQSNIFPNINTGLMWYKAWRDNQSLYIGGAMMNILEPNISFLALKNERLRRRYTIHAGGEIGLSDEFSISPSFMTTMQKPMMMTQFGSNFRYTNRDWNEVALKAGFAYRIVNRFNGFKSAATATPTASSGAPIMGDALTFVGMLEMNRWILGLSYDIQTSNLTNATNGRGAFEVSLVYLHPTDSRSRIFAPRF